MTQQKILNRDFILACTAQFTFSAVYYIYIPTLPIYLSRLGSSKSEIGVLIGIFGVSSLVLRPFVGKALSKIPERNFMMAGALLFAITSLAYLIVPPFWPFLIARVIQGIGLAFFYTASFTLVANISPEGHRGQSLSYFLLAFNIALALAPYFGMLIINQVDFTLLFLVSLGISLCSFFTASKIRKMQGVPLEDPSIRDQPFLSREALPPSIMVFVIMVIWGTLATFFPLYSVSCGVTNPGLFFAAYAIVLILARALGGKILDLYSREKVMWPCLSSFIIAMIILSFSKTLAMFILVSIIWGFANAFAYPALVAFLLDLAGDSRGPAMGTFTAASDLGVGLGTVIMGIIVNLTNYQTMFLCLALLGFINLNYFYFLARKKMKIGIPVHESHSVE